MLTTVLAHPTEVGRMLVFTVRRMLMVLPVLFAASIFVFLLVQTSGDPLAGLRLQTPPVPEATIAAMEQRLYLDRSAPERYLIWLTGFGADGCGWRWFADSCEVGLLRGNFGPSIQEAKDIGDEVGTRALTSMRLLLLATFVGIAMGIATGVLSAVRQYSKLDNVLTFLGFTALAMPIFFIGALIKELAVWVNDNVFGRTVLFTVGANSPDTRGFSAWEYVTDSIGHLILPTMAAALAGYALFSRFQRASMLEVLNSDYIRLARAKGLRQRQVFRRHALRTALIPVTVLAIPAVAAAIDGAVLTETVFQWNALASYLLQGVTNRDVFVVMGVLMLTGVMVVLANLIADLLLAVLDPRIRF